MGWYPNQKRIEMNKIYYNNDEKLTETVRITKKVFQKKVEK